MSATEISFSLIIGCTGCALLDTSLRPSRAEQAFTELDADHRLAAVYTSESLSVSLVADYRIHSRANHNDPVWLSIVSGTAQREQSRRETLWGIPLSVPCGFQVHFAAETSIDEDDVGDREGHAEEPPDETDR